MLMLFIIIVVSHLTGLGVYGLPVVDVLLLNDSDVSMMNSDDEKLETDDNISPPPPVPTIIETIFNQQRKDGEGSEVINSNNDYWVQLEGVQHSSNCPPDWLYYPVTKGCYRLFHQRMSYQRASRQCDAYSSSLATVSTQIELDFIVHNFLSTGVDVIDTNSKPSPSIWMGYRFIPGVKNDSLDPLDGDPNSPPPSPQKPEIRQDIRFLVSGNYTQVHGVGQIKEMDSGMCGLLGVEYDHTVNEYGPVWFAGDCDNDSMFLCNRVLSQFKCKAHDGSLISEGDMFTPMGADVCMSCICHFSQPHACVSTLCVPPQNCVSVISNPDVCCDFTCVTDDTDNTHGKSDDSKWGVNSGVRLIVSCVTSFLILVLMLFLVHRLRQRRMAPFNYRSTISSAGLHLIRHRHRRLNSGGSSVPLNIFNTLNFDDPPPPYAAIKPETPTEDPPPYDMSVILASEGTEDLFTLSDANSSSTLQLTPIGGSADTFYTPAVSGHIGMFGSRNRTRHQSDTDANRSHQRDDTEVRDRSRSFHVNRGVNIDESSSPGVQSSTGTNRAQIGGVSLPALRAGCNSSNSKMVFKKVDQFPPPPSSTSLSTAYRTGSTTNQSINHQPVTGQLSNQMSALQPTNQSFTRDTTGSSQSNRSSAGDSSVIITNQNASYSRPSNRGVYSDSPTHLSWMGGSGTQL